MGVWCLKAGYAQLKRGTILFRRCLDRQPSSILIRLSGQANKVHYAIGGLKETIRDMLKGNTRRDSSS